MKQLEFPTDIQGWCDFGPLYEDMVNKAADGARFVELGVWKGASAAHMCTLINRFNKKIHFDAIDWFKGSPEHVNMSGCYPENLPFEKRDEWLYNECLRILDPAIELGFVTVIKSPIKDAASLYPDNSIDFCFHDGSHSYEDLIIEIPLWWNKIKPSGVFAGHDYANPSYPGVAMAVNHVFTHIITYPSVDGSVTRLDVTYKPSYDSWVVQKP